MNTKSPVPIRVVATLLLAQCMGVDVTKAPDVLEKVLAHLDLVEKAVARDSDG